MKIIDQEYLRAFVRRLLAAKPRKRKAVISEAEARLLDILKEAGP